MAKPKKLTDSQWESQAQEEMATKAKSSNVDTIIQFIKDNGGRQNVKQILIGLDLLEERAVRRPFQKAGLKKGCEAKVINGHRVKLDNSTRPQTYIVE